MFFAHSLTRFVFIVFVLALCTQALLVTPKENTHITPHVEQTTSKSSSTPASPQHPVLLTQHTEAAVTAQAQQTQKEDTAVGFHGTRPVAMYPALPLSTGMSLSLSGMHPMFPLALLLMMMSSDP
eukprot:c155_g1_i1.p1 GENE.c155_g1_i1~~c155_g1_i1.p1  ORF type:complete len:125 (-),score=33.16 c155_g1_i1:319-693(-)